MQFIYLDFEYIESADRKRRHPICVAVQAIFSEFEAQTQCFNLETGRGESEFRSYLHTLDLIKTLFLGYAISGAEIPCLNQIMGPGWVKRTQWVDLWVEFKMFALTHPDFQDVRNNTSLADAIKYFSIPYAAAKEDTRNLILYDEANRKTRALTRLETGELCFTLAERITIHEYCIADTEVLPKLANKLGKCAELYQLEITLQSRIARGGFCKYAGISYALGNGFPMDISKTRAVFANRDRIKKTIQLDCNQQTGFEIYRPLYKGRGIYKQVVGYAFSFEVFEQYLTSVNLLENWARTEKGNRLRTDDEYLDQMLSNNKDILTPLYNARNTLKQLNSTDLSKLMSDDGYIKCPPFPFHQKTSRSSPKPKLGFVLNLSPWLRMLIHPAPGRAFVGIDFKSQEILIAASLAQDELMLTGYLEDFYLSTAINTGFAPENATKKSHPQIRNAFKPISLALLYGQQAKSLAYKFQYINSEWDYNEALENARNFIANHKEKYYKYWEFIDSTYQESMSLGYYQGPGVSEWYYFVASETRTTQLQNVPCQKGGAEMLRMAHDKCVQAGINVIPLHDALYFECKEQDAVMLAKQVSRYMCEASHELLGVDYMSTETTIFTHESPYYDARGEETYNLVMKELGFESETRIKPQEIKDIHK